MYESSVSFSVSAVTYSSNGTAVFASYYDNNSAEQLTRTFPYIANTAMMQNALKEELGANYINGTITAESVASDTNIFKVSVRSNSAQDAYDIVNAVIAVYPDVAAFVVGNVHLNILIKPALATEAYTTNNYIRSGAIMALVGISLGFGIIAVYAFFRNTVRKKDDFKNKLNQKCYVEIPNVVLHRKTKDKNIKKRLVRFSDNHPTFKEAFRLLRKRLLRNLKDNEKIIAVTAAVAGEGKTTVAFNLAHTLAIAGKNVACVDFDMNTRSLQKYFSAENVKGFTDCITDSLDFRVAANTVEENLDIYFAGTKDFSFAEHKFSEFFDYLREEYDYTIVNIVAGGDVSNTVSSANLCDCILMVAKQDSASIDKIRKAIENLSFSRARILGFVFNCVQEGFSGYGGYYGYGHGYGYGYGYGHRNKKYGYGYGYGDETDTKNKHGKRSHYNLQDLPDSEIPDNNM